MPITRQAVKKMRQDIKRTKDNAKKRRVVRDAVKSVRENKSKKNLQSAYSVLDKAVKMRIIHRNKASRLKSRLSAIRPAK